MIFIIIETISVQNIHQILLTGIAILNEIILLERIEHTNNYSQFSSLPQIQNKRIKGAKVIAEKAAKRNEIEDLEEEDDMFLHFNTVLPSPETMRLIEEIERILGEFDSKLSWLTEICSYPYPVDLKKAESVKDGECESVCVCIGREINLSTVCLIFKAASYSHI